MTISRRRLLQLGLLQMGAVAVAQTSTAAETPIMIKCRTSPSVLQGATDESRTQFSIVANAKRPLFFRVQSPSGKIWMPDQVTLEEMPGQTSSVYKVYFSGLYLGESFRLSIFDDQTSEAIEHRSFRTLDVSRGDLKFAICSCMDEFRHESDIWEDLAQKKPDFILFAGDSTYCDYGGGSDTGAARLWRRFAEARATLEVYFSDHLIPILATWDDHDFGVNDSGLQYPYVRESQANFLRFFAMDPQYCRTLQAGPGVASVFVFGEQQIFLMDDRSFRISGKSKDRYAHWGREQEEWMLEALRSHRGMNWIVNGSQIFPQMILKESFSGNHPVQFSAVVKALKDSRRKVAFISGDVHFSEVSEIEASALGYKTYELTSSGVHSKKFPGAPGIIPNNRRIASTGNPNYLLVSPGYRGSESQMLVESCSPLNKINFRLNLKLE